MRKSILTLAGALFLWISAFAQNLSISGKVTNDKNTPLEGVTVVSSDGKYASQTDKDGKYSISVPATVKSLIFSLVSYQTVTKAAKAGVLDVILATSDTKLEEVVVVGYGVQQKKAFTGSAARIETKQFSQLITASVDKQLAGRASGVNVVNNSGTVNAPARIRIRGLNSYGQNRDPLIIVDGVPMVDGNLALVGNSNALGDINPSDIENIDVLKDGSATAIYGSRAANGIIQITTKKGRKNMSAITYDGTFGFSSAQNKFPLLNATQFVQIANEKLINSGALPAAVMDAAGTNTDWQDYIFSKNAFSHSQTLGISGGNNKSTYYLSFNYAGSEGVVITNANKSYRVRMNVDHEASKWLKIGNNLTLSRQKDNDQNNGTNALSGSINGAIRALPNVTIFNGANPTGYNILAYPSNALGQGANARPIDDNYTNIAFVLDNNRYQSDKYRIIDNAFIELTLLKGLKLRSQLGVDYFNDNSLQILDGRHGDGFSLTVPGYIYQGQQNFLKSDIQNYINYNFSIANTHNFFLTVGHELEQTTSRFFSGSGTGISDPFFQKENVISGTIGGTQTVSGNYNKTSLESLFGRLNYDYMGKYFIQGSIRRDGQSALAPGKKYQVFPGASVGWRPIQENFMKGSKVISDMKIKASYAAVGNTLSGYPYLSTYGVRPYAYLGGSAASLIGNPELQGEKSIKYDIGLELGLFNRINITTDVFQNDINNQVLPVPQPYSAGVPNNVISQNIGKIRNTGIEFSVDADVIRYKDFTWNVNANYSYIKNELIKLFDVGGVPTTELLPTNYNINRVGESLFSLYGYRFVGVNSGNGNPVYYNAANQLVQRNVNDGAYYFANSMSDPAFGAATSLSTTDKVILGKGVPTYYGAFTNKFSYKQLSLEVMFRYQGGNKIMNITRQDVLMNTKFFNNSTEILNRWKTPGQITDVPRLVYNTEAGSNSTGEALSRFVEDGSFLKLQNIVFTYQLSSARLAALTNSNIKSARFFIQMQNVYTWTKYTGIDPEAFSEFAQDNGLSPQVRTMSFGLNIGL